jgi:glucose-6-phosphate 1-dehydrogenase
VKFRYKDYFKAEPATGYETLIYDCLIGDNMFFQRANSIEAGWQAVQPILDRGRRPALRDWSSIRPGARGRPARSNC